MKEAIVPIGERVKSGEESGAGPNRKAMFSGSESAGLEDRLHTLDNKLSDLHRRFLELEEIYNRQTERMVLLEEEVLKHKIEVQESLLYFIDKVSKSALAVQSSQLLSQMGALDGKMRILEERLDRYASLFGVKQFRAFRRFFKQLHSPDKRG